MDDALELGGALKRGKLAMRCNEFWDWLSLTGLQKQLPDNLRRQGYTLALCYVMLRAHMCTLLHY